MGKITLYYNCHLLRNHALVKDDLWIQNESIIDPSLVGFACDEAIDCEGAIICPGFIDLKVNGGYGADFSRTVNAQKAVSHVALKLPETGVTLFCPTVVSSSVEYYKTVVPNIEIRNGSVKYGAGVLGVHLDGPFISKERAGAHDLKVLQTFSHGFDSLKEIYGDLENVCLVTLAPELPGTLDVIKNLTRRSVRVSLGHSKCSLLQAERAVNAGASMITHLFNAMPTFHHRDPSLVGLLATDFQENKKIYFGIIADGIHTHPAALRMAYRIAPESLFLVTDGVAPLGLGPGEFTLGNNLCVVVEGESNTPRCIVKGTTTLSGSVAPMNVCIRNFKKHTNCSIVYALEAATYHPALAMGISHKKGTLNFQSDADFVLLDPDTLQVRATYISGKKAYPFSTPTVLEYKEMNDSFHEE